MDFNFQLGKNVEIVFYGMYRFEELYKVYVSCSSTIIEYIFNSFLFSKSSLNKKHYLMGLGLNTKKIPQNSGKQIGIPEDM